MGLIKKSTEGLQKHFTWIDLTEQDLIKCYYVENKPCLGFAMASVFPEFCFIFSHYPQHRKFLYTSRTQLYSRILNRRCSLSLISLFLMNLCYTMWYLVIYDSHHIFSYLFSMNNYTCWQFALIMYILYITIEEPRHSFSQKTTLLETLAIHLGCNE